MRAKKTTWEAVLNDFAQRSGRSVERRFWRWRRIVTVPPDDAISIEVSSVSLGTAHYMTDQLVLRSNTHGDVAARVHISTRNPPGFVIAIGGDPVVYDDPRHDWVAESSNATTAMSFITPDVISLLDQVWRPTSWADVDNHKGQVRVIVGERGTDASSQRLDQLISLMRHLTDAVQSYNGYPRHK